MITQALLLLSLLSITYYPAYIWMYQRWTSADSYYSHGFLISIVVAYLIFVRRDEIKKAAGLKKLFFIGTGSGILFFPISMPSSHKWPG